MMPQFPNRGVIIYQNHQKNMVYTTTICTLLGQSSVQLTIKQ